MGLIANLPVGLAPGLGLDAYVRDLHTYQPKINLLTYTYLLRTVNLFDCRISRVGFDNLPRGHGSGVHGRVSWSISDRNLFTLIHALGYRRIIFFILSLFGLRQWLARIMPQSLVMAVGAGIGLFIAFIGLCELSTFCEIQPIYSSGEASNGLGVIGGNTVNLVGLGGCTAERMPHKLFT